MFCCFLAAPSLTWQHTWSLFPCTGYLVEVWELLDMAYGSKFPDQGLKVGPAWGAWSLNHWITSEVPMNECWEFFVYSESKLSDIWFSNIFSHYRACLLILLTVLWKQKFWILIQFKISNCWCVDHAYVKITDYDKPKKSLPNTWSQMFDPFIVFGFIFRSMTHFELTKYVMRWWQFVFFKGRKFPSIHCFLRVFFFKSGIGIRFFQTFSLPLLKWLYDFLFSFVNVTNCID